MCDFNKTLENRDSANRNANILEINARQIIKDTMFKTNTQECNREITPTGECTS
jgi:hypothetical protein